MWDRVDPREKPWNQARAAFFYTLLNHPFLKSQGKLGAEAHG